MTLVRTAFHGLEQLSALNLAASRELFNTSANGAQQLLGVKDPKELGSVAGAMARPNVDKAYGIFPQPLRSVSQHAARNYLGDGRAVQQHAAQRCWPDRQNGHCFPDRR
ncbi:phasin family protein [Candidatus Accumulibacter necessarius]|uniref:phasin family protein n=1 Tax=Candidatus Accumulibacter necessarius TaxID=2954386 RepID=UPI003DA81471